ncbi:MAG: homoserine kinase [Thiothrix sp.]
MSVYTAVSADELRTFLHDYALGELVDFAGIQAGVENTNYFVTTTQGEYVLTLFEQHTPTEVGYFLALLQHWAEAGIPVAAPQQRHGGQRLGSLKRKPAALVKHLPGVHLDIPSAAECAQLGAMLATLHRSGQSFPHYRAPDRGHEWRMRTGERLLATSGFTDSVLLREELAFQAHIPFAQLPRGVIHADLFRDNVLFHHGQLSGILDVYFACTDSWLYDLAIAVNDWCCQADGRFDPVRLHACLDAYQAVRPWEAIEHDYWQTLLRAAALRFWLSRLDAKLHPRAGDWILQKDPAEFRTKLLQRIAGN